MCTNLKCLGFLFKVIKYTLIIKTLEWGVQKCLSKCFFFRACMPCNCSLHTWIYQIGQKLTLKKCTLWLWKPALLHKTPLSNISSVSLASALLIPTFSYSPQRGLSTPVRHEPPNHRRLWAGDGNLTQVTTRYARSPQHGHDCELISTLRKKTYKK